MRIAYLIFFAVGLIGCGEQVEADAGETAQAALDSAHSITLTPNDEICDGQRITFSAVSATNETRNTARLSCTQQVGLQTDADVVRVLVRDRSADGALVCRVQVRAQTGSRKSTAPLYGCAKEGGCAKRSTDTDDFIGASVLEFSGLTRLVGGPVKEVKVHCKIPAVQDGNASAVTSLETVIFGPLRGN